MRLLLCRLIFGRSPCPDGDISEIKHSVGGLGIAFQLACDASPGQLLDGGGAMKILIRKPQIGVVPVDPGDA
jgi:hypothetical protein